MSGLLELERLLPLCNAGPKFGDAVVRGCAALLSDQSVSPCRRVMKVLDAYGHANNALKLQLLPVVGPLIRQFEAAAAAGSAEDSEEVVKRAVVIWERDDAYARALACLLFAQLPPTWLMTAEVWYRLRQSLASGVEVEWKAASRALHRIVLADCRDCQPLKEMFWDVVECRLADVRGSNNKDSDYGGVMREIEEHIIK